MIISENKNCLYHRLIKISKENILKFLTDTLLGPNAWNTYFPLCTFSLNLLLFKNNNNKKHPNTIKHQN